MEPRELKAVLEAIIYVSEQPVTIRQIVDGLKDVEKDAVQAAMNELVEASRADGRGVEIRKVAGGYRMSTKPEHHEAVRRFVRSQRPPLRLSHQALVTLAVVAYRQPVTGPEIRSIRGVDPTGPLHTLLEKGLIETAGRREVVGRPILYRTTRDFLVRFGLSDLKDLPTEKEFEAMVRASLAEAGELFDEYDAADGKSETSTSISESGLDDAESGVAIVADPEEENRSEPSLRPVESAPAPDGPEE